ncbi:MAG: NAD(P)-dependent oxidoreductase [Betaproteobacteria bacterium]
MHVLITGAGGFIGSVTTRAFLASNWHVTAVCRTPRPTRLPRHARLHIVATDLRQYQDLPGHCDYLVHCAADVPAYCADERELYRSNVEGMQRLLDRATAAGVRRIAYLSSMAVYGTTSVAVVGENTALAEPGIYGASKLEGERLLADWVARSGAAGVSIRLPGVVGAGGRNNFLCDSLQRIIADQAVDASHPGALFNNVVHVDDLAQWIISLADPMPVGHTILTIAAREPLTIRNTLERLYERAGRKQQIDWKDSTRMPFVIAYDRARALGYSAATVADSIDRFVAQTLAQTAN